MFICLSLSDRQVRVSLITLAVMCCCLCLGNQHFISWRHADWYHSSQTLPLVSGIRDIWQSLPSHSSFACLQHIEDLSTALNTFLSNANLWGIPCSMTHFTYYELNSFTKNNDFKQIVSWQPTNAVNEMQSVFGFDHLLLTSHPTLTYLSCLKWIWKSNSFSIWQTWILATYLTSLVKM